MVDLFATVVSQTWMAFGVVIETEALFKNREFVNKASQAEEAASKAKTKAEAIKKQQAEEYVNSLRYLWRSKI